MLTVSRSNSRFARTFASSALATWNVQVSQSPERNVTRTDSRRRESSLDLRIGSSEGYDLVYLPLKLRDINLPGR